MDKIKELKDKLNSVRPADWELLPDIELYKDQVLTYMQRQLLPLENDELLTGAMINNYTKAGALPRPNGKKYGREHLAFLTAICALKPVMSVNDMEYLLKKQNSEVNAESFYRLLCAQIDKSMAVTAEELDVSLDGDGLSEYILSVALRATGLRIVCESMLKLMRDRDEENETDKEKMKKEQNGGKKDKKTE